MAEVLSFVEALRYAAERKVVLPDEYYGKLAGIQRSQAVSIAGLASLEQIKFVIDQVSEAMQKGKTFADFKKAVEANELGVDLPKHRLDNIFRTNMQSAYNRGRWEQQTAVAGTRPYLMYDAINDSRTRPSHVAMDNVILPRTDPWWSTHYPPNGYRCRCTVISLTEKQAQRRGITTTPPDADPDEGFDYNPGTDYQGPIKKTTEKTAAKVKTAAPKVSKKVDAHVKKTAAKAKEAAVTVDDILAKGKKAFEGLNTPSGGGDFADWDDRIKTLVRKHVIKDERKGFLADRVKDRNKKLLDTSKWKIDGTPAALATDGIDPKDIDVILRHLALPEKWLTATNDRYNGQIRFKHTKKERAHALQDIGVIVGSVTNRPVMIHEFMHLVQVSIPELQTLAREFHLRRTKGEALTKMKDAVKHSTYDDWEVTRKDKYFSPYCGKEYDHKTLHGHLGFTSNEPLEILSMGMQALLGNFGSNINSLYAMRLNMLVQDREFAEFIMGLVMHYA